MENETEVMTLEEVNAVISINLTDWQREANMAWLRLVHGLLNEGGIFISPMLGTVYSRHGDGLVLEMARIDIPHNRTEH